MYSKKKAALEGFAKEPLVSVLTPCFNSQAYLAECIESVLAQNYPHVEMIIQDGGSTDGTLEILRKYEGRVDWISEKDGGQSDGLNRALQRCRGDIIGVLNSDDAYLPHAASWAVEQFINLLLNNPLNPGHCTSHVGARCEQKRADWIPEVLMFQAEPHYPFQSLWLESQSGFTRVAFA
jgi:glycosyltransferase involved in cell wall biosynthesis